MEASAYRGAETKAASDGALAELDTQLERLHMAIEDLRSLMEPVLSQRPESPAAESTMQPVPGPQSGLRNRVAVLRSSIGRLDEIIRDVDL